MLNKLKIKLANVSEPGKLKIKIKEKISLLELLNLKNFIKNNDLYIENFYFKKNKLIFIINNNEKIDNEKIDNEIMFPQQEIIKEPFFLEISNILNVSYEDAFSLKELIEDFIETSIDKNINISDSLVSSFSYILKQKFKKDFDSNIIYNFIIYINK